MVSVNLSAITSSQSDVSSEVPVVTTSYKLQSTQEQSKLLTLTSEVKLLQNQSFTTTVVSANKSAIHSTQVHPSSLVPVVTTSHMVLSISPSSSIPEQSMMLTQIPSVNTSQSRRLTATTASANVSGTSSFQTLSSNEVTVVPTSYMVLSTPLIPFTSTQDQSKPLMQTTRVNVSQSRTFTYINVSATPSSQFHPSSVGPVVTTSYVAPSFSPNPSTTELVTTSSVIIISPGVFVRFAIIVSLNESVENASFKNILEKGILAAYENGTLGGMAGNVTVNVSVSD